MMGSQNFTIVNFLPELYVFLAIIFIISLMGLKNGFLWVISAKIWGFLLLLGGLSGLIAFLSLASFEVGPCVWNYNDFVAYSSLFLIFICAASWMRMVRFADKNPKQILKYSLGVLVFLLGALLALASIDFFFLVSGVVLQALGAFSLIKGMTDSVSRSYRFYGGVMICSCAFLMLGVALLYGVSQNFFFQAPSGLPLYKELSLRLVDASKSAHLLSDVGSYFVLFSLFIPLGLFPFHLWVKSFYKTLQGELFWFLVLATPFLFLCLLAKVLCGAPLGPLFLDISLMTRLETDVLLIAGICTVGVATLGTLRENNIQSFVAYTMMSLSGYTVIGMALRSFSGLEAAFFLNALFVFSLIGLSSALLSVHMAVGRGFQRMTHFGELRGLNLQYPYLSLVLGLAILSLACFPPLSSFWAKIKLIYACFDRDRELLGFALAFFCGVTVFSYLRILRYLYADKPICKPEISIQFGSLLLMGLAIVSQIAYNFYGHFYLQAIYQWISGLLRSIVAY